VLLMTRREAVKRGLPILGIFRSCTPSSAPSWLSTIPKGTTL